jgi:hypothetical protein
MNTLEYLYLQKPVKAETELKLVLIPPLFCVFLVRKRITRAKQNYLPDNSSTLRDSQESYISTLKKKKKESGCVCVCVCVYFLS